MGFVNDDRRYENGPSESMIHEPGDESPSILAKAFSVLRAFDVRDRVLTLTEISAKTLLPKSTVHRLLQRLIALEAIEPHGQGYRVGISLLQMVSAMPLDSARELALRHMANLQNWSKSSVHFGVLRGNEFVVLQALFAPDHVQPVAGIGSRLPAGLTAIGRVMLAHLPDDEIDAILSSKILARTEFSVTDPVAIKAVLKLAKVDGYCVQNNEVVLGLRSIAAPILIKGRPVAAVSTHVDSSVPVTASLVSAVQMTAQHIKRDLSGYLADGQQQLFPFDS